MDAANFDHILRKAIAVPVVALLAGAGILAWQISAADATVAQIQLSDLRIDDTLRIEQLIVDQETGLRGYEITRDPRFLDTFQTAKKNLPAAFDARQALVANGQRQAAFEALRNAHDRWEQEVADPLITGIEGGASISGDDVLNFRDKQMIDDIRARITSLNSTTVASRDRATQRWHMQVRRVILGLILAAATLGLTIGFYVRRLMREVSDAFRLSHQVLRVRAEETFRSEEQLRTTLKSIGDGVITCNPEGRVQSINDTAQELTGWTEAEARDKSLSEIFPTFDETTREPLEDPVARVIYSGRTMRLQNHTILQRRDASEIFIEDSGAPIRDKHGRVMGVVLVFRDVTLAKRSQDALLANEKLAVAGRLAASIAHEIHNPLDSVSNLLFLMDGVATPEEREQFLALAKQEIARVTQISRAMLSLYRESKAPVLIDLREMLESLLLLMDTRFQTLGVDVAREIPSDLHVQGFPAELRQVFTNLLTNAAEASSRGGTIRLAAEARVAATDADGIRHDRGVVVTIEDDGPGIPEKILPQLFQPFFTTKGEQGTGLGLWISRGIITKHGGLLDLKSSTDLEDHGTTVNVFLLTEPVVNPVPGLT